MQGLPEVLLVDESREEFAEMGRVDLSLCTVDHVLMCPFPLAMRSKFNPTCTYAVFQDDKRLVNMLCEIYIKPF